MSEEAGYHSGRRDSTQPLRVASTRQRCCKSGPPYRSIDNSRRKFKSIAWNADRYCLCRLARIQRQAMGVGIGWQGQILGRGEHCPCDRGNGLTV